MYTPAATLTLDNAPQVLKEGNAAIAAGQQQFDLSALNNVDSTAVAVLLAWLGTAKARGQTLTFTHLPSNLSSLASLYGATDLLPTSA
jgi:phospholipid transport system transporter-binding protein